MITSRDAKSACFKGSRTSCREIIFGQILARKDHITWWMLPAEKKSQNSWKTVDFDLFSCRGGVCKSTAWKTNLNFWHFLRHAKRGATSMVFLPQSPLLDQSNARTRRSKTCQKYARTRVHRCASSGKHAGSEGWIRTRAPVPTMPRKWSMSHKPHPIQQRAADSLARKKWKIPWNFFSHSKVVLPAVPAMFFSQKFFAHFSLCCQRFFWRFFTIFFAHFFALFFARFFSQNFSHLPFTHFSDTFFHSCVLPKGFS